MGEVRPMSYRVLVVGHGDVAATGQPEQAQVFGGVAKGDGRWIGMITGGAAGVAVGGPPRFGGVRGDCPSMSRWAGRRTRRSAEASSPPGAAHAAQRAVWIDPAISSLRVLSVAPRRRAVIFDPPGDDGRGQPNTRVGIRSPDVLARCHASGSRD